MQSHLLSTTDSSTAAVTAVAAAVTASETLRPVASRGCCLTTLLSVSPVVV